RRLMDDDAAAFRQLAAAFKLDKTDPSRQQAVSRASRQASEVPLEVMRACAALAELAAELAREGNQALRNDAQAAVLTAHAAAAISLGNVRANQPFVEDASWAAEAVQEGGRLLAKLSALARLAEGEPASP
ncbi:MAG TPA: cyclodeaminase/cyclohydrolase family protein, partial [Chloroflexota bacterium]